MKEDALLKVYRYRRRCCVGPHECLRLRCELMESPRSNASSSLCKRYSQKTKHKASAAGLLALNSTSLGAIFQLVYQPFLSSPSLHLIFLSPLSLSLVFLLSASSKFAQEPEVGSFFLSNVETAYLKMSFSKPG